MQVSLLTRHNNISILPLIPFNDYPHSSSFCLIFHSPAVTDKEHKKDILRIASELMLEKVEGLPIAVGNDIHSFIDLLEQEPFDQNSLKRYGLKNEDIMELLKKVFG